MDMSQSTAFRREGDPAFPAEKENDTTSASSAENNETDQTQSSGGEQKPDANKDGGQQQERGFADDPRWKERETDWKTRFNEQETRHLGEVQKLRKEMLELVKTKDQPPTDVPEWFGGDDTAWRQFQEWNSTLIKQAEENAYKRLTSQQQEEQRRIDDATAYFQKEMATIEADKDLNPQGLSVDRNKLLKFVLDNELVDTQGRWNYRAAFKMMNPKEVFQIKQVLQQKKNLASATTSDNRTESKPSSVMTGDDFKKPGARPW